MIGIGTDLVELDRFRLALARTPRLAERLFSEAERAYAARRRDPTERLAARFAAKEAVSKALGVGIFGADGLSWRDVEVLPDRRGRPLVYLYGKAEHRASTLGLTEIAVSLSHDGGLAIALVVAQGPGDGEGLDPVAWRETLSAWVAATKRVPPGGSGVDGGTLLEPVRDPTSGGAAAESWH